MSFFPPGRVFPVLALIIFTVRLPVASAQNTNGSMVVCEAEEYQVQKGGWRRQKYGENYYVGTFANTFLSRKAFLGAPEQCKRSVAVYRATVPSAGRYLALVRYEAAYRFETRFRLIIEQNGITKLDRLYGARESIKIWPFGKRLTNEVAWDWGASENIVWEGHDVEVDLEAGPAVLTLVAEEQPEPAARRNVDVIILTSDREEVAGRIAKENYLPLDGLLTQAGDLHLRVHNSARGAPVRLEVPGGTEHSPYWVHQRSWKPKTVSAAPGETTDWTEVGSLLDSLNDGQWQLNAKKESNLNFSVEFAVKESPDRFRSIRRFENLSGSLALAYDADTRYSRRIRSSEEVLSELIAYLRKHPVHGQAPQRTLIYGATFPSRPGEPKYNALLAEFVKLMGATAFTTDSRDETLSEGLHRGYIDVRDQTPKQLEATCQKLVTDGRADRIAIVSLGDEIGLASPPGKDHAAFRSWLQAKGLKPADVDPTSGGDWEKITYSGDPSRDKPALFYFSTLYRHQFGIQAQKRLTEVLERSLPNALIGANYSPHHAHFYLGETHKWVSLFRDGGMTMPWSEDYIFQVPVGSEQMNFLSLDLFRAGIKGNSKAKIHFYVMPHWPGTTPASWRRQFYGDLAHGAKIFNLFEFRPVQAAYTENHCSSPEMYQAVRQGLRELGQFEDIVQDGQVRPGVAGLWFSDAADIWNDNRSPFDAAKRTLYIAIRHQQLPLDVVVEGDDLSSYQVIYLADQHVSRAASKNLADWVRRGGTLLSTAGAGMFDELDQPNTMLCALLGIEQKELSESKTPIHLEKQDLPFAEPIETIRWKNATMPAFGAKSRISTDGARVEAVFSDGTPAISRNAVGKGTAIYCAFLPGLTYFKPALPKRPVDRSSRDDALCHLIPTAFDKNVGRLIGEVGQVNRPIVASDPLVETTIIEAKQGTVITVNNWGGRPVKNLRVALKFPVSFRQASLATGNRVRAQREATQTVFDFDVDVADTLILR